MQWNWDLIDPHISHEELNLRDMNSHVKYYANWNRSPWLLDSVAQVLNQDATQWMLKAKPKGRLTNLGTSQWVSTYVRAKCTIPAPISDALRSQIWTQILQISLSFLLAPWRHNCFSHSMIWRVEMTSALQRDGSLSTLRVKKKRKIRSWQGWMN